LRKETDWETYETPQAVYFFQIPQITIDLVFYQIYYFHHTVNSTRIRCPVQFGERRGKR